MSNRDRQLSNPFSTGGGGEHFEAHVQASFVALMLTGGYAPGLPCWPIKKIKLQGRIDGFAVDDLIVFVEQPDTESQRKLLGQVKHSIDITAGDAIFGDVMRAAWRDFNDPTIFSKGRDVIALLTGPLNSTDANDVCWLLDQARHQPSSADFFRYVKQTHFSSEPKRRKLAAFESQLRAANNNSDVPKEDFYAFLKHFRLLGYDLGREDGVVVSLLHSHISQFNCGVPSTIWSRIVDTVQCWNQDAGTITLENLPEDLREAFRQRASQVIPAELTVKQAAAPSDRAYLASALYAPVVSLVGSWDEANQADRDVIAQLAKMDYDLFVSSLRDSLQQPQHPVALRNGKWRCTARQAMWDAAGSSLFNDDLDRFRQVATMVLGERDPQFDLPAEERYLSGLHGKTLKYSSELRWGLAEGLALLGSGSSALGNCSRDKPEATAILVVRDLLESADWVMWGGLDQFLPLLAEATPKEFLDQVERALERSPCPFDDLFSQESSGFSGRNYLTGLLWGLETLAWDVEFLVRSCVTLGEIATHDPGGNWANRPTESLTMILLPWFPQTTAPVEKRKVALRTLQRETPEIAWKVLLSLLPNQHQTSLGTHKPAWRSPIPAKWEPNVSKQEYWDVVSYCGDLAVSMALNNAQRLAELITHLDNLPEPSLNKVLEYIGSEDISAISTADRLSLWTNLSAFARRHRRHSDAQWALGDPILARIEAITPKFAPTTPLELYRHLFSDNDFDLYEENDHWEEQRKKLDERRRKAMAEIVSYGRMSAVTHLVDVADSPRQVGSTLGEISDSQMDSSIIPSLLETDNRKIAQFANAYVLSRQYKEGWGWVDGLDSLEWTLTQRTLFLVYLPFSHEVWNRVERWLPDHEEEYWAKAYVNPYRADSELGKAIKKLLDYGRPYAAIECLSRLLRDGQHLDESVVVTALLTAATSSEPQYGLNAYHIVELIKILQQSPNTNPDDLFRVEWAYLPLLDGHHGAVPILLERRLASDPAFFCQVVQLIYRSQREPRPEHEATEQERAITTNAWRLLHQWHLPPGLEDGSFSRSRFTQWLDSVRAICTESGHLEVALTHVGHVLIYSPPDPGGLWIHQAVAEAINARDAEDMRTGFRLELFNSRGVHRIDPTGKPEHELAEQYRQKADDVENGGYQRFAATLRDLAEEYEREANRIVTEHRQEAEEG